MLLLPDFVRPTNKIEVQSSSEQYIMSNSPIISMIVAFLIRWWRGWQRGEAGLNHPNVPTFVAFCGQGDQHPICGFLLTGFSHGFSQEGSRSQFWQSLHFCWRKGATSPLVLLNCSLNWLYLPWFHLSTIWFLFLLSSICQVLSPDWGLG